MLTALYEGAADVAVGDARLQGEELSEAVGAMAARLQGAQVVAVVATPRLETVVAVAGAIAAGCCVVPVNPMAGVVDRRHLLDDAAPDLVIDADDVDLRHRAPLPPLPGDDGSTALVVYTSGTTGAPKGVVLSRRAVTACLDGLARRWQWSASDTLGHALPLFHVHGLVLGVLGPLRLGSALRRTTAFGPVEAATMYFAVPTMWRRAEDAQLRAMRDARLLISGSAALPATTFERVHGLTGRPLVERYGLTESLIVTAATESSASPGAVGTPLDGVRLRVAEADESGLGEVQLAGPTLFDSYLNQPGTTASAHTPDGWLRTGDLGRLDSEGGLRVLGRLATDLIKTGGFKVGAGEVENALLAHPCVAEAAVTGEPDDDLGERIVAWVVATQPIDAAALVEHVTALLAPHKRPRVVRFVDALPRNEMGKVQKSRLTYG